MSKPSSSTIAFVGLGNLGKPMALNLANYLSENGKPALRVWNRTGSKSKAVEEASEGKAIAIDSLGEIARTCNIIISCLANDSSVEAVYEELLKATPTGRKTVFVETSTVYPELSTKLEKQVVSVPDRYFVSSQPFGPPPMAVSASLVFVVAGKKEGRDEVEQYLVPAMGRKIMDFGQDPAKATTFKLIGNSIVLSTVEMLSESMTLADKTGIGADRVLEWVKEFYPAPSAIGYGTKIATNAFKADGGFSVAGGLKDANHIKTLSQSVNCPMHIVEKAIDHLEASRDANTSGEDKDWSSLAAGQRLESGMPPFG